MTGLVRKFRPEAGIWFVIHMAGNGDITGYEYHNWREGGLSPGDYTPLGWEGKFLREVGASYTDDAAVADAAAFLATMRKEIGA